MTQMNSLVFFYKTPTFLKYAKKAEAILNRWERKGTKYLIYGAGIHTRALFNFLKPAPSCLLGFIDQSLSRQKEGFLGFPVYSLEEAAMQKPNGILISSYEYHDEMKANALRLKLDGIEITDLYPSRHEKPATIENNTVLRNKNRENGRGRIAVVDTFFSWPPKGGSSVDLFHLMNRLAENGFEITFFLPVVEDALYFPRGRVLETREINFNVSNIFFKSHEFTVDNFINEIGAAVDKTAPDFIFLGDMYAFKPYLAERLKGYKIIWRSYNYDLICPKMNLVNREGKNCPSYFWDNPGFCRQCVEDDNSINWDQPIYREMALARAFSREYQELLARNLKRSHRVIVYNEILKKKLEALDSKFPTVDMMPTGVDADRFFCNRDLKKNGNTHIFFPGRIEDPVKGFEFFLGIFRTLKKENPDLRLITTAKFDMGEEGVLSQGWMPQEKMPELYEKADLCVIPSLWEEPFGIVALEAMAAGLPVVACAVGGLKQIVLHGTSGFLAKPGDSSEFLGFTEKLINDPCLRREFGEKARERALQYSWGKVFMEYKGMFQ